jgi:hypothetical protein
MPAEIRDALTLLPLTLHMLLLLAMLGLPIVAVASQVLARARRKSFMDRYGRQVCPLAIGLYVYAGVVSAGTWLALARTVPAAGPALDRAMPVLPYIGGAYGAALLSLVVYFSLWKRLKDNKGLHIAIGCAAALLNVAFLVVASGAKRLVLSGLAPDQLPDPARLLPALAGSDLYWPLAAESLALAVGAAGALSLVYLLLRRNRDDYGRDYYTFALQLAAGWALFPTLAALALQAWPLLVAWRLTPATLLDQANIILWAAATGLLLAGCGLWLVLRRSPAPLRRKGTVVLSLILYWAALTCLGLAHLHAFAQPLAGPAA